MFVILDVSIYVPMILIFIRLFINRVILTKLQSFWPMLYRLQSSTQSASRHFLPISVFIPSVIKKQARWRRCTSLLPYNSIWFAQYAKGGANTVSPIGRVSIFCHDLSVSFRYWLQLVWIFRMIYLLIFLRLVINDFELVSIWYF